MPSLAFECVMSVSVCITAAAAALLFPLHCLLSYLGFSSLFCCYVQSAESIDDGALSMLLLLEVLSNVLLQTFFDWWCCYAIQCADGRLHFDGN